MISTPLLIICLSLFHRKSERYKSAHLAGVAELADAPDLGSGGYPCRFKSCHPHQVKHPEISRGVLLCGSADAEPASRLTLISESVQSIICREKFSTVALAKRCFLDIVRRKSFAPTSLLFCSMSALFKCPVTRTKKSRSSERDFFIHCVSVQD